MTITGFRLALHITTTDDPEGKEFNGSSTPITAADLDDPVRLRKLVERLRLITNLSISPEKQLGKPLDACEFDRLYSQVTE